MVPQLCQMDFSITLGAPVLREDVPDFFGGPWLPWTVSLRVWEVGVGRNGQTDKTSRLFLPCCTALNRRLSLSEITPVKQQRPSQICCQDTRQVQGPLRGHGARSQSRGSGPAPSFQVLFLQVPSCLWDAVGWSWAFHKHVYIVPLLPPNLDWVH